MLVEATLGTLQMLQFSSFSLRQHTRKEYGVLNLSLRTRNEFLGPVYALWKVVLPASLAVA